jgi:hypothetical protein
MNSYKIDNFYYPHRQLDKGVMIPARHSLYPPEKTLMDAPLNKLSSRLRNRNLQIWELISQMVENTKKPVTTKPDTKKGDPKKNKTEPTATPAHKK